MDGFFDSHFFSQTIRPCVKDRKHLKTMFVPGCALKAYKPALITAMTDFLRDRSLIDGVWDPCCHSDQRLQGQYGLITCCPGCSRQYETLYPDCSVISLWKVLLETDFPFPDYRGERMSIHDSCHARNRNSSEMQNSVRRLCARMNIHLVEPAHSRDEAICCGGSAPNLETRIKMAFSRAEEFTEQNVVVYCTGCTRSFSVTQVAPRHVLDLLFCQPTEGLYPPHYDPLQKEVTP